jgi:predicted nucleotidyltransferase
MANPAPADMTAVREFVRALRVAGFAVTECIWYGSRALGGDDPLSDFDLIVAAPEFGSLSWVQRIVVAYACWPQAHAADILCYTPEEFRRLAARASIVREALQTGQRIVIEELNHEEREGT